MEKLKGGFDGVTFDTNLTIVTLNYVVWMWSKIGPETLDKQKVCLFNGLVDKWKSCHHILLCHYKHTTFGYLCNTNEAIFGKTLDCCLFAESPLLQNFYTSKVHKVFMKEIHKKISGLFFWRDMTALYDEQV